MRFQVGRFICEMSLDDSGKVKTRWLPWQPRYLNGGERSQYQTGRATFLKSVGGRDELPRGDGAARSGAVRQGRCASCAPRRR
jgi:hypothetical protein